MFVILWAGFTAEPAAARWTPPADVCRRPM